ncbi:NAD-dependent epimerase/dehydratase family protein, partial [Campylobacter coli]
EFIPMKVFHTSIKDQESIERLKNYLLNLECKNANANLVFRYYLEQAMEYLQKFGVSKDSVEIWGSGSVIREFIHAKDLVDASIY